MPFLYQRLSPSLLRTDFPSFVHPIFIRLPFFPTSLSFTGIMPPTLPLRYTFPTFISSSVFSRNPVASLSYFCYIVTHLPVSQHRYIWVFPERKRNELFFFVTVYLRRTKLAGLVDSTPTWWFVPSSRI
jgi:hypothetical protein